MNDLIGAHNELHSEQGGLKGEHWGGARPPPKKHTHIASLVFEKTPLKRAPAV
ncbi:2,3-dihydroxybiphenyl 1,2-dioxygenase, partial [Mycobacteroides abscessus subsp. abscessus]